MSKKIKDLHTERHKTHGDFQTQFTVAQEIKEFIRYEPGYGNLTAPEREVLDMIAHKLSRILTGNPQFKDHWLDIAGYAMLIANVLPDVE